MNKKLMMSVVIGFCMMIFSSANALMSPTILDFEDLYLGENSTVYLQSYNGFEFNRMASGDATDILNENNIIGHVAMFNRNASPIPITQSDGTDFTFNSAWFIASPLSAASITAQGYKGSELLFEKIFEIPIGTGAFVTFDWSGIDKISLSCPVKFGADDITFNNSTSPAPVPEPTTSLLFGTGIIGLAAVGRRRKSQK